MAWLAKYYISVEDAIKHGWKYTPKYDQLTFIFRDSENIIACTQARNFREGAKSKYYNQGSAKQVLPIFGGNEATIVLVEDALSAARIGRLTPSTPCLGSHLPSEKIMALKRLEFKEMICWLDADKLKESREIAERAKWVGFNTRVIYTEKDPKEYSDQQIKEILK